MQRLVPRLWLLLPLAGVACPDDASENLSDTGFSSGQSTTSTTMTTVTSQTTTETTTTETTTSTGSTSTGPTTTGETDTTTSTTSSTGTTATTGTTGETSGTTGAPSCPDDVCYAPAATYALGGTSPSDAAAGDFDGDNNIDIATSNATSNNISVLLGDGDGTLGAATEYNVGTGPDRIAAGELSGDARADIVTANPTSNNVSVLVANAGGGFAAVDNYAVGTTPVDVGLGDIAGGGIDIGVANSGSDNTHVLTNDGAGTFTVDGPYATDGGGNTITPSAVVIGAIGENAAYGDLWYGGLNRYGASPGLAGGGINDGLSVSGVTGSALARAEGIDANGDGFMDIVSVDAAGIVYFQNSGRTDAVYVPTPLSAGTTPSDAAFADVDDDNDIDIVVSNSGSGNVSVLLGNGAGTFAAAVNFDCGASPSGIAVGDLNEDGLADIACSNPGANQVTVLLSVP